MKNKKRNKAELPDIKVIGLFCFKIPSDSPLKNGRTCYLSPFYKGGYFIGILYGLDNAFLILYGSI